MSVILKRVKNNQDIRCVKNNICPKCVEELTPGSRASFKRCPHCKIIFKRYAGAWKYFSYQIVTKASQANTANNFRRKKNFGGKKNGSKKTSRDGRRM